MPKNRSRSPSPSTICEVEVGEIWPDAWNLCVPRAPGQPLFLKGKKPPKTAGRNSNQNSRVPFGLGSRYLHDGL